MRQLFGFRLTDREWQSDYISARLYHARPEAEAAMQIAGQRLEANNCTIIEYFVEDEVQMQI